MLSLQSTVSPSFLTNCFRYIPPRFNTQSSTTRRYWSLGETVKHFKYSSFDVKMLLSLISRWTNVPQRKPWRHSLCQVSLNLIQNNRKVKRPIPDTWSICRQINCTKIRKQCFTNRWECPLPSTLQTFTLFLMSDLSKWRDPISEKRFARRHIVDFFDTGVSLSVSQKSFW